METDGGEMARLRQIGGRPGLVPASSRGGESRKGASEFRPPAPTRRTTRRIVKRRIDKAAPGNSGGLPHPDRTGIPGRFLFKCELDHRAMCSSTSKLPGTYPISGGEDVSSFGSSGAEHFGRMAQEC